MASLKEYYDTDFPHVLNVGTHIEVGKPQGETVRIHARLHYVFDAGTKFISYYVPKAIDQYSVILALLKDPQPTLGIGNATEVLWGFHGELPTSSKRLEFANRYFIYTEEPLTEAESSSLQD